MTALQRGDRVLDPANPSELATVIDGPSVVGGATYFLVLDSSGEELFYKGNELKKQVVQLDSPVAWLADRPLAEPETSARYATHLKITSQLTDLVYSFSSTRTAFRVHQFKPVMKLLDAPVHRLLLADEVGLGKTIEAGLIWSELDARTPLNRVLVLCPSGLRQKWRLEMMRRFDRDVEIADRRRFLALCDVYEQRGDSTRFSAISSFPQLRHPEVLERLSERPPAFDLVIVDEAHAMRNPTTRTHQLGELLAQNCTAMLLLSATPVNLGSNDLFELLRLLRPDDFDDPQLFRSQLEPNRHINAAARHLGSSPPDWDEALGALRRVTETTQRSRFEGDPVYEGLLTTLRSRPTAPGDIARAHRDVLALNTLGEVYTRTRKRELRDQTTRRRARSRVISLSPPERDVYEAVVEFVGRLRRRVNGVAPALAAIMPARQASSCLPVMRDYLRDLTRERVVRADWDEGEEDLDTEGTAEAALIADDVTALEAIDALCARAEGLDSKYDGFLRELETLRSEGAGPVLLFSFFRLTLTYLGRKLEADGWRCAVMSGATPIREREILMQRFRDGDFDILLSSEIGSEGLDFEFCDVVVNYDLPWNPMRLEQRIGRLDRYGQQSPVIHVVHLQVPGTIDTEIFGRLYDRIGIFEDSIGELEPILGEQVRDLNRKLASSELTQDEQRALANDFLLAVEREREDLETFEEARARLVGVDDFIEGELEAAREERRYVTSAELSRYVGGFLRDEVLPARLDLDDVAGTGTLSGSPALAEVLRNHGASFSTPTFRQFVANLEAGGSVSVTFDAERARISDAEFITLRHPLVRAIMAFHATERPFHRGGYARVRSSDLSGSWLYYVFLLQATGMVSRRELFVLARDRTSGAVDVEAGRQVLRHFAGPEVERIEERDVPIIDAEEAAAAYDHLLADVASRCDDLQVELQVRNDALVDSRQTHLRLGLEARRSRLVDLLSQPGIDERIRRMRSSQIRNLESRCASDIDRLERSRNVSVGYKVVAGGLVDFV